MLSKKDSKFITSLKISKYRTINQKFIAEGPKLVTEFLHSSFHIEKIFAVPEWIKVNQKSISKGTDIIEVSEDELHRISGLKTPNQVVAVIRIPSSGENKLPDFTSGLTLMLDEIKDPGNMGTIIRTADWFGIQQIICSENAVDIYNPKVVQSTMGSLTRVEVYYTDLGKLLESLPHQIKVYGACARR